MFLVARLASHSMLLLPFTKLLTSSFHVPTSSQSPNAWCKNRLFIVFTLEIPKNTRSREAWANARKYADRCIRGGVICAILRKSFVLLVFENRRWCVDWIWESRWNVSSEKLQMFQLRGSISWSGFRKCLERRKSAWATSSSSNAQCNCNAFN